MQKTNPRVISLILALTWASTATAQPSLDEEMALIYGDNSTVSIATGNKQLVRRAPAVTTVITSEQIAAMGATNLDAVLETVPGIHVSRASIRYASTYIIRGIYTGQTNPQVLLLQNGIPTTTMYTGDKGYAWHGSPVQNIARIEVIRGPGSALYGANAYAGVINIITKTASETLGTKSGIRIGSFNSKNIWLQHGGKWGVMDAAAFLNIGATDGIRAIIGADAQTANDKRYATNASLAPGPVNTGYNAIDASLSLSYDKWRLRTAYKLRDKLGTGAGISSALDPNSRGKAENVSANLSWNDPSFTRDLQLGVTTAIQYYTSTQPNNLQLYPPGTKLGANIYPNGLIGGPNSWDRQIRLSGHASYSGFSGHSLRFGIGHNDLNLYRTKTINNFKLSAAGAPILTGPAIDYSTIQPFITPHKRRINYLYAQDEWNFTRDWTLTAGVRHDRYSDFGGTTNPRLALVWDTTYELTSKLLYGRAFRAPSFNEQYGTNPVANGNAKLKPETIQTLEAAFSWQARKNTKINLSLFRYEMQNIIRLVNNTAPALGSTYQNVGSQQGNGMELEAVWDVSRTLRLTGNYAHQKSINKATGLDAGYAPHQQFYLRTDWHYPNGWVASAQLNRVTDRKRAAGDTRPPVPNYTTVDITTQTPHLKRGWNFSASVRNLFNTSVFEPSMGSAMGSRIPGDLPMARRSLWLQATHDL